VSETEQIASGADRPADTFLHVADLHFWKVTVNPFRLLNKRLLGNANVWLRRRHEFPMAEAERLIDGLESTGVRQLLLTGDFSSTSLDEEFAMGRGFVDTLQRRGFSMHLMPGNHDVYTFESVRRRRFERHFQPFLPEGGYPALETLPGGTPLLLVPTVCPNLVSSRGRITLEQVAKAAEMLPRDAPSVVVAGHYPLLDETEGYALSPGRRLRNAAALRSALGMSGPRILYVAGHVHRFGYTRDPEYPNLLHLCTGAFFRRNEPEDIDGEFSRVRIFRGRFDVYRHTLRESWETILVDPDRRG